MSEAEQRLGQKGLCTLRESAGLLPLEWGAWPRFHGEQMLPLLLLLLLPLVAGQAPATKKLDEVRARRLVEVQRLFAAAGVAYPAPQLFLRAHKQERELELWAGPAHGALKRVHVFPVCAASGLLGPKREEGDGQVPEGVYRIDRLNPWSQFHLSLGLDYPNHADRLRSRGVKPGGDIFIHGQCVSIGCLAIEDSGIELLYLAVAATRERYRTQVPVLLLPRRMDPAGLAALREASKKDPKLRAFWDSLAAVDAAFEVDRRVPTTRVDDRTGLYVLAPAGR